MEPIDRISFLQELGQLRETVRNTGDKVSDISTRLVDINSCLISDSDARQSVEAVWLRLYAALLAIDTGRDGKATTSSVKGLAGMADVALQEFCERFR